MDAFQRMVKASAIWLNSKSCHVRRAHLFCVSLRFLPFPCLYTLNILLLELCSGLLACCVRCLTEVIHSGESGLPSSAIQHAGRNYT